MPFGAALGSCRFGPAQRWSGQMLRNLQTNTSMDTNELHPVMDIRTSIPAGLVTNQVRPNLKREFIAGL